LALGALSACTGESESRPNIILVTVDTLRWDYLNSYGFPDAGHSPAVARLASQGVLFENAVTTIGTTIPSHGSMLTGEYARVHGARSNFHHKYPQVPTITTSLAEAGYQTGAYVSNVHMFTVGGLDEGFEATNDQSMNDQPELGNLFTGGNTVRLANRWLESTDADRPFFLWLHLWEPHGPYDVTEWSRSRMADYEGLLRDGMRLEHMQRHKAEVLDSPENTAAMRTLYAGEVHLADRHLGRFLDDLEAKGLLADSVVIFTADHGQSLGEKRKMGHGPVHRETVLRVPLIIADFRNPAPQRVATRVGTIDIAPTIAELAGLNERFDQSGQSLVHCPCTALI
jgi:arylsulfatase A-like enzyme